MPPFRIKTPKHRPNRRACKHYKSYKSTLRIDFEKRCGYCNDLDINRIRSFVIDHFVPQNPDGWTHQIPPNKYSNLVYACPFCNGAKSNKWPTKSANKSNDGILGFVNPTLKKYGNMFQRLADGSIQAKNGDSVARYMYNELEFGLEIHSLNWKFETILAQEEQLKILIKNTSDPALKKALQALRISRLEVVDMINNLYNDK